MNELVAPLNDIEEGDTDELLDNKEQEEEDGHDLQRGNERIPIVSHKKFGKSNEYQPPMKDKPPEADQKIVCIELTNNNHIYLRYEDCWTIRDVTIYITITILQ